MLKVRKKQSDVRLRLARDERFLRDLVLCLARDARELGKAALADELEALEESIHRDFQAQGPWGQE